MRGAEHERVLGPLNRWPAFAEAVRARLEQGQIEYGDASFHRPPEERKVGP
jgi:hypothetical protein